MQKAEVGTGYVTVGTCREQKCTVGTRVQINVESRGGQCASEHRFLQNAEVSSGWVSAGPCREQCCAVSIVVQVHAESRGVIGHVSAGTFRELSGHWASECRYIQ